MRLVSHLLLLSVSITLAFAKSPCVEEGGGGGGSGKKVWTLCNGMDGGKCCHKCNEGYKSHGAGACGGTSNKVCCLPDCRGSQGKLGEYCRENPKCPCTEEMSDCNLGKGICECIKFYKLKDGKCFNVKAYMLKELQAFYRLVLNPKTILAKIVNESDKLKKELQKNKDYLPKGFVGEKERKINTLVKKAYDAIIGQL